MTRNVGMILLAIFLAIECILALTNIQVVAVNVIRGCVAGGAAVCILLGK